MRTIEDRAHAEIDRSRQEIKGLRSQLTTMEREHVAFAAKSHQLAEEALAATTAAQHDVAAQRARAEALEHQLAQFGDLQAVMQATLAKARENPTPRRAKSQAASRGQRKSRKSG